MYNLHNCFLFLLLYVYTKKTKKKLRKINSNALKNDNSFYNNMPSINEKYRLTLKGKKLILDNISTFSSELILLYFHQKDIMYYDETIGDIKKMVKETVPKRLYIKIKYVYTDCTDPLHKKCGIPIDDTKK